MDGEATAEGSLLLKGDAISDVALPSIHANEATTLVLFLVEMNASASDAGTISGR